MAFAEARPPTTRTGRADVRSMPGPGPELALSRASNWNAECPADVRSNWTSGHLRSKTGHFKAGFQQLVRVKAIESSGFMERAMGIEPNALRR